MLRIAEIIDAYRVFPRIVLLGFMISVGVITNWYLSFEDVPIIECNETLLLGLLERNVSLVEAQMVACKQTGVVDRPFGYTTLVSVFIGASAGVFGFYVGTGRRWDEYKSNRHNSSADGIRNVVSVQRTTGNETGARGGEQGLPRTRSEDNNY